MKKASFISFDFLYDCLNSMYYAKEYPNGVDKIKFFTDEERDKYFEEKKSGIVVRICNYYIRVYNSYITEFDEFTGKPIVFSRNICEVIIGRSKAKRVSPEEVFGLIDSAHSIKRKYKLNKLLD